MHFVMNSPCLRQLRVLTPLSCRPFSSLRSVQNPPILLRSLSLQSPRRIRTRQRNDYFSSGAPQPPQQEAKVEEAGRNTKRKTTRSSAAKNSLRRVAVEAQRSRDGREPRRTPIAAPQTACKTVTAMCAAEEYRIAEVARILADLGYVLDPYKTELYPQVVHVALPVQTNPANPEETSVGDLFVFPSGTAVAWEIPEGLLAPLVSKTLLPAAKYPLDKVGEEVLEDSEDPKRESLEYSEDPNRENSSIKGERIILGTKSKSTQTISDDEFETARSPTVEGIQTQSRNLDTVLAKIAFSSGLARSTKLAVLESLLEDYFESTKSIPAQLSRGGRMPFTRSFISQKTGQLLSIRAQLNLYSELTDSLPDLFWDSRHELGLEGYYDQVGRALDINIRIKVLNEKMDYAQEIASVLREHLSEAHGVRLEWIIIALIAVEVFFAIQREIKEYLERRAAKPEERLQKPLNVD